MKYSISYECRADGNVYHGSFDIDSPDIPESTDPSVIDLARKDSVRFVRSGMAGLTIVAIAPKKE